MNNSTEQIDVIIKRLRRLFHKYTTLEKTPIRYDAEVTLPPGEIHTIQAIGKNRDINVKELSEYFDISKSAASQMVSKLVKKGYVIKNNPASNNKEMILSLTSKGWQAFSLHESFHTTQQEDLTKRLQAAFGEDELIRTDEILHLIEDVIDERITVFTKDK